MDQMNIFPFPITQLHTVHTNTRQMTTETVMNQRQRSHMLIILQSHRQMLLSQGTPPPSQTTEVILSAKQQAGSRIKIAHRSFMNVF